MIKGIHHIALAVADLHAARRFYCLAASLKLAPELALPLPEGMSDSCMLSGANGSLRLLATPSAPPMARPVCDAGITHVCLQGIDANALHARFGDAGASFHSDPVDLGTGYLYCYARDPETNVIELEGVAPVWEDGAPWFAHVAMSTAALEPMADFYGAVLGSAPVRSPRFANSRRLDRVTALSKVDLEAAWIPGQNMQVELMQYFSPPTVTRKALSPPRGPGYLYIALEVDDLSTELARLLALGATVPPKLAGHRSDTNAFCADPDGNILLLLALSPSQSAHAVAALPDPLITARLTAALAHRAKTKATS